MLAVKLVILVLLKWSGTGTTARLWHDVKITGPRQVVKNKVFSTVATWDRLQSANDCGVASRREEDFQVVVIIIMYSYHALNDGLSAYMMHINLNTIFYIHLEHPTETICIKYYMKGGKKPAMNSNIYGTDLLKTVNIFVLLLSISVVYWLGYVFFNLFIQIKFKFKILYCLLQS